MPTGTTIDRQSTELGMAFAPRPAERVLRALGGVNSDVSKEVDDANNAIITGRLATAQTIQGFHLDPKCLRARCIARVGM
jgi:hypothetical protein